MRSEDFRQRWLSQGRDNGDSRDSPGFPHTCARYNKVENEFPNDTNEEEQLTEGSEPYFPLPAFPQDDIWPELLEKIISYSKKPNNTTHCSWEAPCMQTFVYAPR